MLRKQLKYDPGLLYELSNYSPWLLSILPSQSITMVAVTGVNRVHVLRYVKSLIDGFHLTTGLVQTYRLLMDGSTKQVMVCLSQAVK